LGSSLSQEDSQPCGIASEDAALFIPWVDCILDQQVVVNRFVKGNSFIAGSVTLRWMQVYENEHCGTKPEAPNAKLCKKCFFELANDAKGIAFSKSLHLFRSETCEDKKVASKVGSMYVCIFILFHHHHHEDD
jgi:hypothetical protein